MRLKFRLRAPNVKEIKDRLYGRIGFPPSFYGLGTATLVRKVLTRQKVVDFVEEALFATCVFFHYSVTFA